MSRFLRKVRTAPGATAVQIVEKRHGQRRILEHLGSAHDEAELAALMRIGHDRLHANQPALDLPTSSGPQAGAAVVQATCSQLLVDVVRSSWDRLGFGVVADEAFFQLVLARLVEPTSKADSVRVVSELSLRKVGYSKERRVDPQIVVGLLVDRTGFPLEIACFEGNKAETHTIIPIVKAFQDRHQVADMVIAADAGMLSATNLDAIDAAQLRFIVGSRVVKAPLDLAKHFRWHGNAFSDGQIIDTITTRRGGPDPDRIATRAEPVWDPAQHPTRWRAVWSYSHKRAQRDRRTLALQRERAEDIVNGTRPARKARFVTTTGQHTRLDQAALQRAEDLVGLKGYVTNITAQVMPADHIIGAYHDLWRIEQSFRMSKTDLAARPIFHRTRDAIEAHLTIVFTALAIARDLQARTGWSIKKIIHALRPLRQVTITLAGQQIQAEPTIPTDIAHMLNDATGH